MNDAATLRELEVWLPGSRAGELDAVEVLGSPLAAYRFVRGHDFAESRLVRGLFALRGLTGRRGEEGGPRVAIDALPPGFVVLEDVPGVGVTIGAIGRFWRPEVELAATTAEAFAGFAAPGWAKLVVQARFEATGAGRTRVTVELRVRATDAGAREALRAYLRVIGPFSRMIRHEALEAVAAALGAATPRPRSTAADVAEGFVGALGVLVDLGTPFLRGVRARWGVSAEEAAGRFPGDELVPAPRWGWTHGIEIAAPAAAVWPWVAQIGQGRAGFYSYQWLENLAGCEIQNADRIHPEWQAVAVGDPFRLHPEGPPLRVAGVEAGRFFVVQGGRDDAAPPPEGDDPDARVSWLFLVEPIDRLRCRFISRYRVAYREGVTPRLLYGPYLIESIGFVMDRRMLLGVKERAEGRLGTPQGALATSPG